MIDALVAAFLGILAGIAVTLAVQRVRAGSDPYPSPARPNLPGPYEDGRTQRMLAAFPFAAFLLDSTGVVRYVNAAAEELFEASDRPSAHRRRAVGGDGAASARGYCRRDVDARHHDR
jgi:PAS domain-containing protein